MSLKTKTGETGDHCQYCQEPEGETPFVYNTCHECWNRIDANADREVDEAIIERLFTERTRRAEDNQHYTTDSVDAIKSPF